MHRHSKKQPLLRLAESYFGAPQLEVPAHAPAHVHVYSVNIDVTTDGVVPSAQSKIAPEGAAVVKTPLARPQADTVRGPTAVALTSTSGLEQVAVAPYRRVRNSA